jgi:hypothetical protein
MISQDVWDGVHAFLQNYVKPRDDDFFVVAYTPDSREPAAWVCLALKIMGIVVVELWMSPIRDDSILQRLDHILPDPSKLTGRLVLITLERDTMSHDNKFKEALRSYDKERCLIFRAISASDSLFLTALRADPAEIDSLNATLLEKMMQAKRLHIETPGGSNIDVVLDNKRHQWISNRGKWRPGRSVILPAGEVATFPASVSGVFVADFAFNLNAVTSRDTRLQNTPVKIVLKDGKAVDYDCVDLEITKFLDQCFNKYCVSNVGELGFGTNRMIKEAIAMNSHINERKPGIHLGFGQHNQDPGIVPYRCDIHLDLVADGGDLWIDDDDSPINLASFPPSNKLHPSIFRDEDVFSPDLDDLEVEDCCGILKQGEMRLFKLD